ncbi:glycoside hydrolase [Pantoea cypripedii]|uniref:glycoside hydrolase n=1 Tax=Pantoea cypripedii TaxID=55209 RepID=UPI002FC87918
MNWFCTTSLACLILFFTSPVNAVRLQQGGEVFDIDPVTLQIEVGNTVVNAPQSKQKVSELQTSANEASWSWPLRGIRIIAQARSHELRLVFRSTQVQQLSWFSLPPEASELLLPIGEGSRIPLDNPEWQKYLVHEQAEIDTNFDMKLPLWSQKQQSKTYSWLLLTPFHNKVSFSQAGGQLKMQSQHEFNRFNQQQIFEVLLYVGKSPLSGALRYREYLQDTGRFSTLREKIVIAPEGQKLIGATHIYLWGNQLLAPQDVKDWRGLLRYLQTPPAAALRRSIGADAENVMQQLRDQEPRGWQLATLIAGINSALMSQFPLNTTPDEDNFLQSQAQQARQVRELAQQQIGSYLVASDHWGQGLSVPVIDELKQAGLSRLWLGVDNWTAAFLHPGAVTRARVLGYLMASYDSYDTAIPRGLNDNWLTAQLPAVIRDTCAIVQADGSKKPGFAGAGYYLNPACVMSYSLQRMRTLTQLAGLNSLFLDVDGTGMVADDYQPSHPTGAADMAAARNTRMARFSHQLKLPLGSEDGNALTNRYLLFAHGMETWGFGWQDADMRHNRNSPYYLGAWWPDAQPATFFHPAQLKPLYRTVIFDPRYRLPLYQAVFHDAVINTHHWTLDNLKFPEVKTTRDLLSLLYNTPALFNLSRDTLAARLPDIIEADARFRPLHMVLWDKALTDFRWLDSDGWVQQTTFSDGSVLIANFSEQAFREIPAKSFEARLSDGQHLRFSMTQ